MPLIIRVRIRAFIKVNKTENTYFTRIEHNGDSEEISRTESQRLLRYRLTPLSGTMTKLDPMEGLDCTFFLIRNNVKRLRLKLIANF